MVKSKDSCDGAVLYNVKQVCGMLGVGKNLVYKYIKEGKIKFFNIGGYKTTMHNIKQFIAYLEKEKMVN